MAPILLVGIDRSIARGAQQPTRFPDDHHTPSLLSSWRNRARPPGRPQPRGSARDRLAIRLLLGHHPVRRLRQMPRDRPDGLGMALAACEPRVEPGEMAPGIVAALQ